MDAVNSLIQELLGYSPAGTLEDYKTLEEPEGESDVYRLPFKYTAIIGDFSPGLVNSSHPSGHFGVDLQQVKGTPIHPIAPGKVLRTGNSPRSGLFVTLSHEDGTVTSFYAHCDSINVSVGDEVEFKDQIATVGATGNAAKLGTSAHLHIEVGINGKKIDPMSIFGKKIGSFSKKANNINKLIKKANEEIDTNYYVVEIFSKKNTFSTYQSAKDFAEEYITNRNSKSDSFSLVWHRYTSNASLPDKPHSDEYLIGVLFQANIIRDSDEEILYYNDDRQVGSLYKIVGAKISDEIKNKLKLLPREAQAVFVTIQNIDMDAGTNYVTSFGPELFASSRYNIKVISSKSAHNGNQGTRVITSLSNEVCDIANVYLKNLSEGQISVAIDILLENGLIKESKPSNYWQKGILSAKEDNSKQAQRSFSKINKLIKKANESEIDGIYYNVNIYDDDNDNYFKTYQEAKNFAEEYATNKNQQSNDSILIWRSYWGNGNEFLPDKPRSWNDHFIGRLEYSQVNRSDDTPYYSPPTQVGILEKIYNDMPLGEDKAKLQLLSVEAQLVFWAISIIYDKCILGFATSFGPELFALSRNNIKLNINRNSDPNSISSLKYNMYKSNLAKACNIAKIYLNKLSEGQISVAIDILLEKEFIEESKPSQFFKQTIISAKEDNSKQAQIELSVLKILNKFAKLEFKDQTYSDNWGKWNTSDIVSYAIENGEETEFDIDNLAEIAFQPSSEETGDEVPGSPEFIERAMATDLSYPITVVRYDDGDFIADGNHRLWKTKELGYKTINGYLLNQEDLLNIEQNK